MSAQILILPVIRIERHGGCDDRIGRRHGAVRGARGPAVIVPFQPLDAILTRVAAVLNAEPQP